MQIVGDVAGELAAAPFVAKTYRMVNDPVTDGVITWGRENNSFVVVDPFAFSQTLLPSYFKHGNFSSFVRQLNTYGFRKVDPDRWEFAHAFFLRGQTNLLRQIVRRKKGRGEEKEDETAKTEAATEVVILKREQMAFGKRADEVWLRLQEAERKQRRLLTFLGKLVGGDPQLMGRLIAKAGISDGEGVEWEKRARLRRDGGQLPSLMPGEEAGESVEFFGLDGFGMGINGEEAGFGSIEMDPFFASNSF